MKKIKTKNNKKHVQKGKWSIWKTIVSVFSAVGLVSGATVVGVYFAGGFEEKVVLPESIEFTYDTNLFQNGQLEISGVEEFSLTISSPTEEVNKDRIKLSFGEAYSKANAKISNGKITVPEEVYLDKAFTVTLDTKEFSYDIDGDGNNEFSFENIVGGISTLYAESIDNKLCDKTSLKIAVDTPVHKIESQVVDLSGNPTSIEAGQEFKMATTFYPAQSKYMYGDETREKLVLFEITTGESYISNTSYDEEYNVHFQASVGFDGGVKIDAYTFKHAITQQNPADTWDWNDKEEQISSRYGKLFNILKSSVGKYVSDEGITVEKKIAEISNFSVAKNNKSINVVEDTKTPIYVNGINSNESLGISIDSSDGKILSEMLENVALEFIHANGTPFSEDDIGEGKAFNVGGRKIAVDEKILFLPYNEVDDSNNCYWDITSSLTQDVTVNVYLALAGSDGYSLFESEGGAIVKRTFTIKTTKPAEENAPEFIGQDETNTVPTTTTVLEMDDNKIVPQTINLRSYINVGANQGVRFYVKAIGEGADISKIIQGPFNGTSGDWTILMDSSIKIIGAGSFDVKFETLTTDQTVSKICEATKTFVFEQALSEGAVEETKVLTYQANDLVTGENAYLTTISGDKIELSFTVATTSLSAFKKAFEDGKISLSVFTESEEITQYFSITPAISSNKLTYTLLVSKMPDEDKTIAKFVLKYQKDDDSTNDIKWEMIPLKSETEGKSGISIVIYKPKTENITISDEIPEQITYTQTLTNAGLTEEIKDVDNTPIEGGLTAFITSIRGNVKLADQHGRVDALGGGWKFVCQAGENCVNIESQTFNIKGSGEIKLQIQAIDNQIVAKISGSEYDYTLTITSNAQGIEKLKYQNSKSTTETTLTESTEINSVTVEKYGKEGTTFTLNELVKYYLTDEAEYTNTKFLFTDSYIAGLTDEQLKNLYGKDGMLEIGLTEEEREDASAIRSALKGFLLTSIEVKYNFGIDHPILLEITDPNHTFSTTFTFKLLNNVNIQEIDYEDERNAIYCEVSKGLTNQITYHEGSVENLTLGDIYSGTDEEGKAKIWYIVQEEGACIIKSVVNGENYIGTIENGEITFTDFFDEEHKSYIICFDDENSFKRKFNVTFKVWRNLNIAGTENKYYLVTNDGMTDIGRYLTLSRSKAVTDDTLSINDFNFETTETYLIIDARELKPKTKESIKFGYNEQALIETVYIKYNGTTIGEQKIEIEFANDAGANSLYKKLAELFKFGTEELTGQIQKIGDVSYLVLDTNYGSKLLWSMEDEFKGKKISIQTNTESKCYRKVSDIGLNLAPTDAITKDSVLAGLRDEKYYIALQVAVGNNVKVDFKVPLIISKVGSSPISTDTDLKGNELENALNMAVDNLSYKEVTAGQDITLEELARYSSGQNIKFDSEWAKLLEEKGYQVNKDIIKEILLTGEYPKILLNNLDEEYGDIYLPLAWTVEDVEFYYLMRITPNVEIEGPVYAYNNDAEYMTCDKDKAYTIDFGEEFNEKTLNKGKQRFKISTIESEEEGEIATIEEMPLLTTFTFEYVIKSVNGYSQANQWADIISIDSINGEKLTFTPKVTEPITLIVQINSITDNDGRITIFNEKTYIIKINQNTKSYVAKLSNGSEGTLVDNGDNVYTWKISNINGGIRDVDIKLMDTVGTTETTVYYETLKVATSEDCTDKINKYEYNSAKNENAGVPGTTLRLTLKDYISKDETLTFILYTAEYGYLATLNVELSANATVELVDSNELNGGESKLFNDIFKVSLNGEENNSYDIDSVSFETDRTIDQNFVTYDSENIRVANLFEDISNVKMTATLKWGENSYTFTQVFTLKANVKLKTSDLPDGKVVAGNGLTLKALEFIDVEIEDAQIECESGERWNVEGNGSSEVTITPNYINTQTTYTLTLTIKLPSSCNSDAYAIKTFNFTITVYPAVELTANYPNPSGSAQLGCEYIKDGETTNNIVEFLNSKAVYSDSNRIVVEEMSLNEGTLSKIISGTGLATGDDTSLKVTISKLQNAKIVSTDEDDISYEQGQELDLDKGLEFTRGTTGLSSIITFSILYKGYSEKYTIEICDEIYTFTANYQTNNIESGEYKESETTSIVVTYEALYIDKTNLGNLFENNRMAKFTLNESVKTEAYRFVFSEDEAYYVSQNVTIFATDGGKFMTYDLGYNLSDKTLVGIYLANDLADEDKFSISDGELLTLSSKSEDKEISVLLDTLKNYKTDVISGDITYTSRIELYYGGEKVDYSKYKEDITPTEISKSETGINKLIAINSTDYTFEYYYKLELDIDVQEKATSAQNWIEVEVNDEQRSIVEYFKIYHSNLSTKTNLALVTKNEFNKNVNLSFEVVESDDDFNKFMTETDNAYKNLSFVDNKTINYFRIEVQKQNSQDGIYDFGFYPEGAKNDGDFVLTKLTYTAFEVKKEFYVVIKIVPDYMVTFNGDINSSIEQDDDYNNIVSNVSSPVNIKDYSGDYYSTFTLLKSSTEEDGFLSIRHKNGNKIDTELATGFTTTLPLNKEHYNSSINVTNKLMKKQNLGNWNKKTESEYELIGYSIFTDVPKVIFGNQDYYINVVDKYGFRVRLYFTLVTTGSTPIQNGKDISITEGSAIDITASYETLTITEGTKTGDETPLTITSTVNSPSGSSDINLIELTGLDAYLFDKDYTNYLLKRKKYDSENDLSDYANEDEITIAKNDAGDVYNDTVKITYGGDSICREKEITVAFANTVTVKNANGKTLKFTKGETSSKITPTSDEESISLTGTGIFASLNAGDKITISGISDNDIEIWYNDDQIKENTKMYFTYDGNKEITVVGPNDNYDIYLKSETESGYKQLKTSGEGYSLEAGYTLDENYTKYLNVPKINYVTINKITIKDSNNNSLNEISLEGSKIATNDALVFNGFNSRAPEGKFNIQTLSANVFGENDTARVTMYIELQYADGTNTEICTVPVNITVVRGLILEDYTENIAIDNTGIDLAKIFKLKNSTSPSSNLTFINDTLEVKVPKGESVTFTLTKNETITSKSITIDNSIYVYDKTYYYSLSKIMNEDVKENDKFTIQSDNSSVTFKYISNDAKNVLSENSFTIAKITEDKIQVDDVSQLGKDTHTSDETDNYYRQEKYYLVSNDRKNYYRFTKNYYVTGKYYKLTNSSLDEIDDFLLQNNTGSTTTSANIWGKNLLFRKLAVSGDVVKEWTAKPAQTADLYFEINRTESSENSPATIDNTNGEITITSDFTRENYVTIDIYQIISGNDSHHFLGSIRLGCTTTELSGGDANTIGSAWPDPTAGFVYSYDNTSKTATVTGTNKNLMLDEKEIPETVNRYTVIAIADGAFKGCENITSIKLPDSLTYIGKDIFNGCTSLNEVEFNGSKAKKGWFVKDSSDALTSYSYSIAESGTVTSSKAPLKEDLTETYKDYEWIRIPDMEEFDQIKFISCSYTEGNPIDKGTATVSSATSSSEPNSKKTASGAIAIPEQVSEKGIIYTITSIVDNAFAGCDITSVTIPSGVTSIGCLAFKNCTHLKTLTIADDSKLKIINGMAFYGCSSLTSVKIPKEVETINLLAFACCTSLNELEVASGNATYLGYDNAIYTKSDNTLVIGCKGTSEIKSGTTAIGVNAFYGSGLTEIEIPESVTKISENAFANCTALTTFTFKENSTCQTIGVSAFYGSGLTAITIPASVTEIGDKAFACCTSLNELEVANGNTTYTSDNNAIYKDTTLVIGCKGTGEIKSSTTAIGVNAFYGSGLTSITIPQNVSYIGAYAFGGCESLESVTFNNTYGWKAGTTELSSSSLSNESTAATYLTQTYVACTWKIANVNDYNGVLAFGCAETETSPAEQVASVSAENTGISGEIKIPAAVVFGNAVYKVTSIKKAGENTVNGFQDCNQITSITIPNSINEIAEEAFIGCTRLETLKVNGTGGTYYSENNAIYQNIKDESGDITDVILVVGCKDTSEIKSGTTQIGKNAFRDSSGLTSITLPESVTKISENAFASCSSLTSIEIPKNVSTIENGVFSGCTSLTTLTVANGNTTYTSEDNAIYKDTTLVIGCNGTGAIKSNTTGIETYAFMATTFASITLPESVTKIESHAFYSSSLTSITIPQNVSYIGTYAFGGCTSLTNVEFKNAYGWVAGTTELSSSSLSNESTAATYLTQTYVARIWTIESENSYNQLSFSITDAEAQTVSVSAKYLELSNPSITIPAVVVKNNKVYKVTSVADDGFKGREISSVDFSKSIITTIGKSAFEDCAFCSITFNEGLTTIDEKAFRGAMNEIMTLTFPSTLKTIGEFAFSVTANHVEQRNWSFANNSQIQEIKSYAFANVQNLTMTIPKGGAHGSYAGVVISGYAFNCKIRNGIYTFVSNANVKLAEGCWEYNTFNEYYDNVSGNAITSAYFSQTIKFVSD